MCAHAHTSHTLIIVIIHTHSAYMCICLHTHVNCNVHTSTHRYYMAVHPPYIQDRRALELWQQLSSAHASCVPCSCPPIFSALWLVTGSFVAHVPFCFPTLLALQVYQKKENVNDKRVHTESLTTYKYFLIKLSAPLLKASVCDRQ